MAKPKSALSVKDKCPYCKEAIVVIVQKEVITKAIPGEYKTKIKIEKDSQTTLPKKGEK